MVLASEVAGDVFTLDRRGYLIDLSDGKKFVAKNNNNVYPFDFLKTSPEKDNRLVCSACDGKLTCNYPGTEGNVFGLCYGYLVLAERGIYGIDSNSDGHVDCTEIEMQFS